MLIYVPTSLRLEGEPVAIQSKIILHWPMRNRHGHFTPFTGHWSLAVGLVLKKIKSLVPKYLYPQELRAWPIRNVYISGPFIKISPISKLLVFFPSFYRLGKFVMYRKRIIISRIYKK